MAWFDEHHPESVDSFKYHVWYRVLEGSVVYVVAVNYRGRDPEELDRRLRTS
ncbi:MAG: hypothetical protein J7480_09075 [Microbacteriaceae bacterium]|nr:hypothetical protein [Microbacteriaceae bacterium]